MMQASRQPDENRSGGPDLRSSQRHDYPFGQRIAPIYGNQLPAQSDFFPVECHNLSRGGLSFYFDKEPDFKQFIAVLGCRPTVTHVSARVVHVERVEQHGRVVYRVGSQFTGHVDLPYV